jgi:SAM-dependent methyltransferase
VNTEDNLNLTDHLEKYGIHHFHDESYYTFFDEALSEKLKCKISRFFEDSADRAVTEAKNKNFYELIADPNVARVVHSLKADAIRASGVEVLKLLGDAKSVLDLGCGLGYLTTAYATAVPDAHVLGCDRSRMTLHHARTIASKLGVGSVDFAHWQPDVPLPEGEWDVVVSTQFLCQLDSWLALLAVVKDSLSNNGRIISVDAFQPDDAGEFLTEVEAVGLHIASFGWARFSDLGMSGSYPVMVLSKTEPTNDLPDIADEWSAEAARVAIANSGQCGAVP